MTPVRILRSIALLLALTLCGGCTMLRIGYGQLDTMAAWKADEYFDLDSQQKHDFRVRFDALHEWHRREQLPEYAAFLGEAKSRLEKSPTRADVEWFAQGITTRYRTVVRRAHPDAVVLLVSLKPDQLEVLQKQWERDNRRYIREHKLKGDMTERKRARSERNLDQIREWTGALTPEQEQRIIALSDALPPINHLRLEERIRRQRELRQLLEARAGPDFGPRFQRWLLDWESGRSPEYKRVHEEWWKMRVDFFLAVHDLLTPQQRAQVSRRVQNYVEDFRFLADRQASR
jgi:hypothetical protein